MTFSTLNVSYPLDGIWFAAIWTHCLFTPPQLLVTKSTENINNLNNEGYTPLHLSCQFDKPDCVKSLLAAGADANIQSAKTKGPTNNIANNSKSRLFDVNFVI